MGQERPVDNSMLVEYVEPPILPHERERVLDYHMLHTSHQFWKQDLIKWKDHLEEGSTWENISVLRKIFLLLFSRMKNLFEGGSNVKTMVL